MDNEDDDEEAEDDENDQAKAVGLSEGNDEEDVESGHKIRTIKTMPSDRKATIWSRFRGSIREPRPRKHHPISSTSERCGRGVRKNVQLLPASSREIYVLQSHDSRHTINCECESI